MSWSAKLFCFATGRALEVSGGGGGGGGGWGGGGGGGGGGGEGVD